MSQAASLLGWHHEHHAAWLGIVNAHCEPRAAPAGPAAALRSSTPIAACRRDAAPSSGSRLCISNDGGRPSRASAAHQPLPRGELAATDGEAVRLPPPSVRRPAEALSTANDPPARAARTAPASGLSQLQSAVAADCQAGGSLAYEGYAVDVADQQLHFHLMRGQQCAERTLVLSRDNSWAVFVLGRQLPPLHPALLRLGARSFLGVADVRTALRQLKAAHVCAGQCDKAAFGAFMDVQRGGRLFPAGAVNADTQPSACVETCSFQHWNGARVEWTVRAQPAAGSSAEAPSLDGCALLLLSPKQRCSACGKVTETLRKAAVRWQEAVAPAFNQPAGAPAP